MQRNISDTNLLSGGFPQTTTALPAYPASTLRLLSTGETDLADTTLRLFLMLCLVASVAICGFQSRPAAAAGDAAPLAPAWSQLVPHVRALPGVQSCSLAR